MRGGRLQHPRSPVGEHPEAVRMADGVILLAQVREIDVAEPVCGIEHHLQRAVADHQVAGHAHWPPSAVVGVQLAPGWGRTILRPALPGLPQLRFPAPSRETPESLNGALGLRMRSHTLHPPAMTGLDSSPPYHDRGSPLGVAESKIEPTREGSTAAERPGRVPVGTGTARP